MATTPLGPGNYISVPTTWASNRGQGTSLTVNIDIFALLNFRASSSRRHIHVAILARTYQLILFVLL